MKKYCFLDVETTGLDPKNDSLIEIAYIIQNEAGEIITSYDQIIFPTKTPLTDHVSHITGITEEIIQNEGVDMSSIREKIQNDIQDTIIIGHNINFDLECLEANGLIIDHKKRIDTHELARIVLAGEKSYSLEILAQTYGFEHTNAHRALSDVEASKDLFWFLRSKIQTLPQSFLSLVRPFLEAQPQWLAKDFFLNAKGSEIEQTRPKKEILPNTLTPLPKTQTPDPQIGEPVYVHGFSAQKSAQWLMRAGMSFTQQNEKILLITPKIRFFEPFSPVPTPEVLLDPKKLHTEFEAPTQHSTRMITFLLKCAHRNHLGFRGKHHFDLFFLERDFWNNYCLKDTESEYFQSILQEKLAEPYPCMTPRAYFQLKNYLQDRVLLIDEGETFAQNMLESPTKTISFSHVLDAKDDKTSVKAHFWVSRFCQEVLQPILQKSFGIFPEKILFPTGWKGEQWFDDLEFLQNDTQLKALHTVFTNTSLTRWACYYPEKGNLLIKYWKKEDWEEQKNHLKNQKIILFHRHKRSESNAFFRVWLGLEKGTAHRVPALEPTCTYALSRSDVSLKSPEYNDTCAQKILTETQNHPESPNSIVVVAGSLDTIKKTALKLDALCEQNKSPYKVLAERLTGGKGKMLQILEHTPQNVLFMQSIVHPSLEKLSVKHIFLQKFPFPAPNPLLDALKPDVETNGLSLWDLWTIPQVAAKISQTMSPYDTTNVPVTILDPRHNARWAKSLLFTTFANYK